LRFINKMHLIISELDEHSVKKFYCKTTTTTITRQYLVFIEYFLMFF